jgi:hypothetical protein
VRAGQSEGDMGSRARADPEYSSSARRTRGLECELVSMTCCSSGIFVARGRMSWFDQQIPAGCDEYHSEAERTTYISWSGPATSARRST